MKLKYGLNEESAVRWDGDLISGSVISSGRNSISEIGFVYATSPSPTKLSGAKVVAGQGAGFFIIRPMGLESGTTYGNEVSFTISPWYYLKVDDGSGGIYKIYLSDIGAAADEDNNNVKALVARYNESLGIDETQGRVLCL